MKGYLLNGVSRFALFAPADEGGGAAPAAPVEGAPAAAAAAEPPAVAAVGDKPAAPSSVLSEARVEVAETPEAKTAREATERQAAEVLTAAQERVKTREKETPELRASREKNETAEQKAARLADEKLVGDLSAKAVDAARERLKALASETPEQKAAREAKETPEQKAAREADEKLVKDKEAADKVVLGKAYEAIKLPDGMPRDQPAFVDFVKEAVELGIPLEHGQRLVDKIAPKLQAAVNAPYELWANTIVGWVKTAENDPEYGGADYKKNLGFAAIYLDALGGDEKGRAALREAYAFTGAGNHPEIIRSMIRGGKRIAEGGPAGGGGARDERTLGQKAYPDMVAKP